jgi:hypothetical protein
LHTTVPIGYVRTEDNRVELDPDPRIREAISSVFNRFAQAGSVRQVLLWFRREHIELPAVVYDLYDDGRRSVVWRLHTYPSPSPNLLWYPRSPPSSRADAARLGRAIVDRGSPFGVFA